MYLFANSEVKKLQELLCEKIKTLDKLSSILFMNFKTLNPLKSYNKSDLKNLMFFMIDE